MQILIAVIEDLFQFAKHALSGAVPYAKPSQVTIESYQETLKKIQKTAPSVSMPRTDAAPKAVHIQKSLQVGEQYFIGTVDSSMYQDPVLAFDNAVTKLKYGQNVRLISLQGRWAQVRLAGMVGWVFKDSLVMKSSDVYPYFTRDIQYDSKNPQTIKLRACIDDAFGGAASGYVLSAAEYVQYRLTQKNRIIDWGDIRMRIPGTWQRKLAGRTGIHIGIAPKTESVMEYVYDDMGHLAFVEAVFPDESIKISEIGKYDDASYTELTLSCEEWKELSPVFIESE